MVQAKKTMNSVEQAEDVAVELREAVLELKTQLNARFVGQELIIDQVLASILARGHALLEGGPGLGKTLLVKLTGKLLGLEVSRIQFTPDLMPSDIIGGQVLESTATGPVTRFEPGPIFSQLVLADEINRANPRTQAAMLEAMAERQVTIGGVSKPLGPPFFVLATNNPIEMEGTYPLPEAQADRFMIKLVVKPPNRETLLRILDVQPDDVLASAEPVISVERLLLFQAHVARLPAAESVRQLIADLVLATQPDSPVLERGNYVQLGASPRAAQAILAVARARAAMAGRLHVVEDDVRSIAADVLGHRLVLDYAARADGIEPRALIADVLKRI
ncbi:MAG: AAA family ATPase [Bradymonadia bacterium]